MLPPSDVEDGSICVKSRQVSACWKCLQAQLSFWMGQVYLESLDGNSGA